MRAGVLCIVRGETIEVERGDISGQHGLPHIFHRRRVMLLVILQIELLRQNRQAIDLVHPDIAGAVSGQDEIGFLAGAVVAACAAHRLGRVRTIRVGIKI